MGEWITCDEKNAINQETGSLGALAGGMHGVASDTLSGHWRHKRPNIGSTVCWAGRDRSTVYN